MSSANDIFSFWFEELSSKDWFKKSVELDALIRQRFSGTYVAAVKGELYTWRETAAGRLAEILVLDQFSRNMFRDMPEAFAHDNLAVILSQEAIHAGADADLPVGQRAFLYMPLMHSESLVVHDLALRVFDQPGLERNLDFEKKHKAIIDRFGRYPHRNEILRRQSSPEEIEFLNGPGSSF